MKNSERLSAVACADCGCLKTNHKNGLGTCVHCGIECTRFRSVASTETPTHKSWLRGYAAALAAMQRLCNESSTVCSLMVADGLTLRDFRRAGVEDFDMTELRHAARGDTPMARAARR